MRFSVSPIGRATAPKIRPATSVYDATINVARKSLKLAAQSEARRRKLAAEKKAAAEARAEKCARKIKFHRIDAQQDLRRKRRAEGRAILVKRGVIQP